MTYAPTTWVDDSPPGTGTPVNAANLNKIEAGIAAALPSSSVAAAGAGVLGNKLLASDTQPAFALMGDGRLWWGPGGSVSVDTTLYRRSANTLGTVGSFVSEGALTGWGFYTIATGDTSPRSFLRNDGRLFFGDGASNADTSLYRAGAATLKTDGELDIGGLLVSGWMGSEWALSVYNNGHVYLTTGGSGQLHIGTDTTLYRISAGKLGIVSDLHVTGNLTVGGTFPSSGGGAALTSQSSFLTGDVGFGSATTLYDGPSLTLAAGTWLIIGSANILSGSSTNVYARLTDGSTTFADGNNWVGGSTSAVSIPLAATVSPTGSTTYKIQGSAGNSGVATMKATASINGVANKATYLVALKIA